MRITAIHSATALSGDEKAPSRNSRNTRDAKDAIVDRWISTSAYVSAKFMLRLR
jgi:hypothetical protein